MDLPPISEEQQNIITQLQNHNVVVDSVAGSGKTTCNLYIAKQFPQLRILLLTYNARLKLETREKAAELGLNNIEIHSYHSFCVKYYNRKTFTDTIMRQVLRSNSRILKIFTYDLLICDEAQDITPLYFELLCKMYRDNRNKDAKLCIIGDKNQSIYDFMNADQRFIRFANKIFTFNGIAWQKCNLSESFRITHHMANFVNKSMLSYERIQSHKQSKNKPRYLICDSFGDTYTDSFGQVRHKKGHDFRTFEEVQYYLGMGYAPKDIMILSYSLRSAKTPARQLENKIKRTMPSIPVFVPSSDEEKLDRSVIQDKMLFSTFHQAKGLERKVIIVFNFDDAFFTYFKKESDPRICPNELYVAVTRGLEQLTLIHHYKNEYLPFLNPSTLSSVCEMERGGVRLDPKKIILDDTNSIETAATDLSRHLPQEIIDQSVKFLTIKREKPAQDKIKIPLKVRGSYKHNSMTTKGGFENVSDITGTAIPAYFEYRLTNEYMSIFDYITENLKYFKKFNTSKYKIEEMSLDTLSIDELLFLSNVYCSDQSGYIYKLSQIQQYDWLTQQHLEACLKRLSQIGISPSAYFEVAFSRKEERELLNRELVGVVDCLDSKTNTLYEFKCVDKLTSDHFLQVALYMYLHKMDLAEREQFSDRTRNIRLKMEKTIQEKEKIKFKQKSGERIGHILSKQRNGNILVRPESSHGLITIQPSDIIEYLSKKKEDDVVVPEKENAKDTMFQYKLYNILTDELYSIDCELEDLKKMVAFLIDEKYGTKKTDSDEKFIEKMIQIREKWLKE